MKEKKNVKINVNMFDDTKLKIIDTKPERDLIHYIWFRMVALAGKVNREGELYLSKNIPFTPETLAIEFNRGTYQINTALDVLIELEMIEIVDGNVYKVKNFTKHQNGTKKSKNKTEAKPENAAEQHNISTVTNEHDSVNHENSPEPIDIQVIKEDISETTNTNRYTMSNYNEEKSIDKSENEKKNDVDVINLYNNKENAKIKNKSKTRKKKKTKSSNNIECQDIDECDIDDDIITFYEGDLIIPDEKIISCWDF